MNEMTLSSLIQIMQDGFIQHDKQESAGRFLLESVTIQEDSLCTTDLNSKKISRLVSRKDPVPDDIKQAALRNDIAVKVEEYFRQKVMSDINPYTKDDVLQKLMNIIIQDAEIAQRKKNEFQRLYNAEDDAYFLYSVFMYVLQRNNKIIANAVEYQDAPLLAEVNYECPLTHEKLVEEVKGIPKKKYEITQIFPNDLPSELAATFNTVYPRPKNLDAPENLIALSQEASENYLMSPMVDEYKKLYEIKQVTSKQYKAINAINRIELEAEIRAAIEGLISINPSDVLPQLEYVALRIDQKISDALLMNDVRNHVLQYYRYIETIFSEMTDVFDDIAGEVKLSSQKLEKAGLSQEDVIYNLTEWIHNKVFAGDTKGKMACRIVVCFFIQNCEVFYKNEISK
ncbi:TPA: ABC-three component system protein [Streptococcus suis]